MSFRMPEKMGSKVKKKHFKPKQQKAKLFRANEPLLSVLMWGVNHTVGGLIHVNVPVMLMPDDFKAFSKIRIDNHCFNKENMPSHFKVKEYCPLVFRNLRERFGVREEDYVNSLSKSEPIPVESGNKSNAKLYESYDRMFIIEVLQSEEVEFMHTLLKYYHPYVVEKHGKILLPRYLGLYRLTVDGAETYLLVMQNIFSQRFKIHCKYDLKGTAVDREANSKEKIKDLPTLKDGDFIQDGGKLHLGQSNKEKIMDILTSDVEFLSRLHVMEYSVCLGIHDCQVAGEEAEDRILSQDEEDFQDDDIMDSGGVVITPPDSPNIIAFSDNKTSLLKPISHPYAIFSSEGAPRREIYFMGLVDILSHGTRKRTATISATQPELYGKRLLDFMSNAML